jgi:hypothetical protein
MLLANLGYLSTDAIEETRLLLDSWSSDSILRDLVSYAEGDHFVFLTGDSGRLAVLHEGVVLLGPEGAHRLQGVDTGDFEVDQKLAYPDDLF